MFEESVLPTFGEKREVDILHSFQIKVAAMFFWGEVEVLGTYCCRYYISSQGQGRPLSGWKRRTGVH